MTPRHARRLSAGSLLLALRRELSSDDVRKVNRRGGVAIAGAAMAGPAAFVAPPELQPVRAPSSESLDLRAETLRQTLETASSSCSSGACSYLDWW
jgi:hypothetical protein